MMASVALFYKLPRDKFDIQGFEKGTIVSRRIDLQRLRAFAVPLHNKLKQPEKSPETKPQNSPNRKPYAIDAIFHRLSNGIRQNNTVIWGRFIGNISESASNMK
jgi:hypothetical protein